MGETSCCTPAGDRNNGVFKAQKFAPARSAPDFETVQVTGSEALVGTSQPIFSQDSEGPLTKKRIRPFEMATTTVTNAEFEAFVKDTGHVTEAEHHGWSFVFWAQVPEHIGLTQAVAAAQWWRRVDGANWRDINGPETQAEAWQPDHPVVQVSWHDAQAYASWAGGRLPSEAEWEHAARGGLGDVRYPWGDQDPDDASFQPCNIWQGRFPEHNTMADGYVATAPAKSFEANGLGLYNMVGNVWEWTADPFRIRSQKKAAKLRQSQMRGYKLVKGGSFLCHASYCWRYRIAARTGNSPDSTTTHTGFRMVWDS